jgi:hypothetical protein
MEEFIKSIHSLRECYGKHEFETLKNEDRPSLEKLCFNEKKVLAKTLQALNMKDLINERLNIMAENKNAEANARSGELDNLWK